MAKNRTSIRKAITTTRPFDPNELADRLKKVVFWDAAPTYQRSIGYDYRKINQNLPLFPDLGIDKFGGKLMLPALDSILTDYNPSGALLGPEYDWNGSP